MSMQMYCGFFFIAHVSGGNEVRLALRCRLDVYIHDYLVKRNLQASAKAFSNEGKVSSDPVGMFYPPSHDHHIFKLPQNYFCNNSLMVDFCSYRCTWWFFV
jgi:hypothetical protein